MLLIVTRFGFFITHTVVDLVVTETNREAKHWFMERNDANPEQVKVWTALGDTEMKAFIGLCLFAGIQRSNDETVTSLWSENGRHAPVFPITMSRTRFKDLKF